MKNIVSSVSIIQLTEIKWKQRVCVQFEIWITQIYVFIAHKQNTGGINTSEI